MAAAFRSLEAAAIELLTMEIPVEVIICIDKPDPLSLEVAKNLSKSCRFRAELLKVNFGDLSHSRNRSVRSARHSWIAFLDADDLWSFNWLKAAHQYLLNFDKPEHIILHPEIDIFFPDGYIHPMPNQEQLTDPLGTLLADNVWDSLSIAHRSIYLKHPYRENRLSHGFGYEDWAWNYETVKAGFIHRVVPKTCHFKRRSPQSLSQRSRDLSVLVTPPLL